MKTKLEVYSFPHLICNFIVYFSQAFRVKSSLDFDESYTLPATQGEIENCMRSEFFAVARKAFSSEAFETRSLGDFGGRGEASRQSVHVVDDSDNQRSETSLEVSLPVL